jgi:pyridoxal phosphate enzyme (YggS family)
VTPTLQANLAHVRSRIAAAARRAGRRGEDIDLVAVTKTVEPEVAADLVRLGQLDLGESRAGELERKGRVLRAAGLAPRWHFIGHLQGNKVRRVVAQSHSIHSIDSLHLLEAVDRAAAEIGARPEVWIQVKLTHEPTKTGLDRRDLAALFDRAAVLPNVRLAGLMTLAPLVPEAEVEASARRTFRDLADLARQLARPDRMGDALRPQRVRTSMGMSSDFEWAVEEGSDLLRIGSLLFEGCPSTREKTP